MKSIRVILPILLAFCLLLCCCAADPKPAESTVPSETAHQAPRHTGTPGVQLTQKYIFHDKLLYLCKEENVNTLSAAAKSIGKITKVDNESFPDEELEATGLEIGTSIFEYNGELYAAVQTGRYYRFAPIGKMVDK